jgi:hypothetical protein
MLHGILRDPAPVDGGGGVTPPATPPPTPPPAAPPPAAPAAPAMVPLTVEEYQRLRGLEREIADTRAEKARQVEEAERQRSLAIAAKEGAEKGLEAERTRLEAKIAETNTRYADLERQYLTEKKALAIADALSGVKFISSEAERQMRQLLEPQFAATRDAAGQPVVRDATTGRPAADVIKEAIASKGYDHFLDPATRGGSGAGATNRPEPARVANGDRVAQQLRDQIDRARAGGAPGLAGTYSSN